MRCDKFEKRDRLAGHVERPAAACIDPILDEPLPLTNR
jgi:hypothetical protein